MTLHQKYGYNFEQMDQERRTRHGHNSPKVDIVIWASISAKNEGRAPIIVVECKSDNVTIDPDDYEQGDSYTRAIGEPCEFLVMHNHKETRFFKIVRGLPGTREDIENIPCLEDLSDAQKMEEIRRATKAFSREEFRRLLFDCHCILRDNHKMEPGQAFDEISKILFIKMFIERTGNHEKFTTRYLDQYASIRRRNIDEVMHDLFDDTKTHYRVDELFAVDDKLEISFATFRRIVQKLERFNLGATHDDVKGIAFERFLGQTFRGDLGQFFTPRPIVDFMVEFFDPEDSHVMCDPASGSGGFLIKFFEYVRNKIEFEVHQEKKELREQIESRNISEDTKAKLINESYMELNTQLDVSREGTRLWSIAHKSIFGCDAERRAARTSKMNMIMHGDGHGGIHHHDGLVNFNGIFPGRFDIILTNPPFGSNVGDDQIVGATPETRVSTSPALNSHYESEYGEAYRMHHEKMVVAERNKDKIISLFTLSGKKRQKTEVLFIERCLDLLKPGGKLGIVVPDGILNNPSLSKVRAFIEDNARILGVISIPDKTFKSSKANVKASLLFLQKYSLEDLDRITATRRQAEENTFESLKEELTNLSKACEITWTQYKRLRNDLDNIPEDMIGAFNLVSASVDAETLRQRKKELAKQYDLLQQLPSSNAIRAIKSAHDYFIFMAVAEHVGIRASGKDDPLNELPQILEVWNAYQRDNSVVPHDVTKSTFKVKWSEIDRWDPASYRPIEWKCSPEILKPFGKYLKQRIDPVDREEFDFSELTPITIHFDGSIDPRDITDSDDYTMDQYFARAGDIVVSKIDLKNGAVGIVPGNLSNVAVTNHFVVYEPDFEHIYPPYIVRMIQTAFFKGYLWRKKVGTEGRKEVKIDLLESTLIPIPSLSEQKALISKWCELEKQKEDLERAMSIEKSNLDVKLLSCRP